MLFLALSCLQGRTQQNALDELSTLGADGIQLTPGNIATEGFWESLEASGLAWSTHHGYTADARRKRIWSDDGELVGKSSSIHPPEAQHHAKFTEQLQSGSLCDEVLEVMYPGYCLGHGRDIETAMEVGQPLAIDVSHLKIQVIGGHIDPSTLYKLLDYEFIAEIHVSCNNGVKDTHQPLSSTTYKLGWASERYRSGALVVYEGYMHRLSQDDRLRQVDLVMNHINY